MSEIVNLSPESEDELFRFLKEDEKVYSEKIIAPRYSYWKSVFRVFFRKKSNIFLLTLFTLLMLAIVFVPIFFKYDVMENVTDASTYNLSPAEATKRFGSGLKYIFGTGSTGNAIFLGLFSAAQTSLKLSFTCAIINMVAGVIVGAFWGYSKKADVVLLVIYNIFGNVPTTLLTAVLVYVIGSGFWSLVIAFTLFGWLFVAFFFRTQVMIIRDREYSLASRCLGTPITRIVSRNVLPFLTSVIVTLLAAELPGYISSEVFLSFAGLGLSASVPSLGRMITLGQSAFLTYPWAFWPPVAMASLVTLILYLLGQHLADASDPRTHML
ncbi:MAG: ABC transporter permease [Lachnospiraceae bacterium]|nr:ABC transporter permease [Lachnospiraceae bacterium]